MDDLDALLEDLQAVVPRSERERSTPATSSSAISRTPAVDGRSSTSGSANASNGFSQNANGNTVDGGSNKMSSTVGGGGNMISPITHASTNLAELDSLLESLNSPSLGMDLDDEGLRALGISTDGGLNSKHQSMYPPPPRPDVGNLLSSLDNAVSIDTKSTSPQSDGSMTDLPPPPASASTATRDLDALMASLNDFQMSTSVSAGGGNVKPLSSTGSGNSDLYAQPKTVLQNTGHDAGPSNSPGKSAGAAQGPPASEADIVSSAARLSQLDNMLGHLQSDMSRHGISNASKGTCSACQKDIVGQVITALGRTWHPQHFVCVCCNTELATKSFFERDGKAYCEKDYHEKFAPKCAYCDGPILDRCMTALSKTWHPEHFICAHCGNPFGPTENFHEKDGRPYCRNDYYSLFAPKCGACDRPIVDSFVSALKKQWHPECFNCMECGEPFKGGNFFEHDLMPYCEKHYYNRQGALCSQCKKPVTGRCITAMGQKYHPEHFVCALCMKQLSMGTFKEHGERPYCMQCYGNLFG